MDIKELKEIIELVQSSGITSLRNIFKKELEDTQVQALFNGIETNQFENEEDAASKLYNSVPSDKAYMMLRLNLGDTLAHDIIFFDFSKRFSTLTNKTFILSKTLIGIRILLAAGKRQIAARLAKRLYHEATEYDATQIRLNCLRILREIALLDGQIELSATYSEELKKVSELFLHELRAEEECQKIEAHYIYSANRNPEIANEAFKYEDSLQEIRAQGTSFTIELYRYRILLYAYQISYRLLEAIEICEEIVGLLQQYPRFNSKSRESEFTYTAMKCSLLLRDYSRVILYGERLLELQPKGKSNWYKVIFNIVLAALHVSNYELALQMYKLAITHNGMEKLHAFEQEKWELLRGFISLLYTTGTVTTEDKKLIKEFKLSDFINSLPELAKDKGGLNIPIHVLQILYYLYKHQHKQATNRIDLFKRYVQRYLSEEEYYRTHIFLSMLKNLRKVHYDTVKAEKLCEKYYKELTCTPEKPEQFIEFNEIIPYDILWQWILKNCKLGKFEVVGTIQKSV